MPINQIAVPLFCLIPILFGALLTSGEVAKILGIKSRQASRLISDGRIKGKKLGRDWVVEEADLQEYQKVRRTHGGARPGSGRPKQKME